MNTVSTIEEARGLIRDWKGRGERVAFVPTMGALHEGHLELVRQAAALADRTMVSIFVNPTQFGAGEDLASYPRDLAADRRKLDGIGVDLVFAPSVDEMYPPGAQTFVEVKELSRPLCGAARPVHFRGVATVVTRLFVALEPDVAVFGEKDFQQLTVIRRLVRDLGLPVEVVGVETVREQDGLAMSSRNEYLARAEREQATVLSRAMEKARASFAAGERRPERLHRSVVEELGGASLGEIDYAELRDPRELQLVTDRDARPDDRFFLAVRFGRARLIDNMPLGSRS